MAEEKETSASSSALSSFEHHISVKLGAEAWKDHISCDAVTFLDTLEVKRGMNIHLDNWVDSYLT